MEAFMKKMVVQFLAMASLVIPFSAHAAFFDFLRSQDSINSNSCEEIMYQAWGEKDRKAALLLSQYSQNTGVDYFSRRPNKKETWATFAALNICASGGIALTYATGGSAAPALMGCAGAPALAGGRVAELEAEVPRAYLDSQFAFAALSVLARGTYAEETFRDSYALLSSQVTQNTLLEDSDIRMAGVALAKETAGCTASIPTFLDVTNKALKIAAERKAAR
jgi:hypothetical protein